MTLTKNPHSVNRHAVLAQIARQRDRVLDLDLHVDEVRAMVNLDVERLREAVRTRDREAVHLAKLIDWHDELESIAATFGPEIAEQFNAQLAGTSAV